MDLRESLRGIFFALIAVYWLYLVYEVLRHLFGGSLTTDQLLLAGIGFLTVQLFSLKGDVSGLKAGFAQLDRGMQRVEVAMEGLRKDFHAHLLLHAPGKASA